MRRNPNIILYLYLFSVAFHGFIGWRLIPPLDFSPILQGGLWLLLALSAWLTPAALIGTRFPHPRWGNVIAWSGFISMGLVSTLFVLALLRDLLLGILWLVQLWQPDWIQLENARTTSAATVWVASRSIRAKG